MRINKIYKNTSFEFEILKIQKQQVVVNLISKYGKEQTYIFKNIAINLREFSALCIFLVASVIWINDKITKKELETLSQYPIIVKNKDGKLLFMDNLININGK